MGFRLRTNVMFSLAHKLLACVVLQYLNGATIYVWKSRRDELFAESVLEAVALTEPLCCSFMMISLVKVTRLVRHACQIFFLCLGAGLVAVERS